MIETVTGQLQSANGLLGANLEGVDHAASVHQPVPAGNCLNWIVGHMTAAYDNLLPVLGGDPVLTPEQKALYERGGVPLTEIDKAMQFDELREAFGTAHDRILAGLARLPPERLAEPAPFSPTNNPDETIGSLLAVFAFHQAYHVGQLGLGRRIAGLGNAVA